MQWGPNQFFFYILFRLNAQQCSFPLFSPKKKKNVSLLTAITAMLNHQAEFGVILAEIYDPALGVPSGEVTPRRVQTAPESVQAVDDFQAVMREMRDILLPEVVSESAVVAVSANKKRSVVPIVIFHLRIPIVSQYVSPESPMKYQHKRVLSCIYGI